MIREIGILLRLKFRNLFGINEAKRQKSKKASTVVTALAVILLCGILCLYVGAMSYLLCVIGIGEVVPTFLCLLTSLVVFFFTLFKAGGELFDLRSYEILAPYPLKKSSIIASKLLGIFITDAALSLFVFISGGVGYVLFESPDFAFYPLMIIGAIFTPLLPISLACFLGAGVYAITSRLKKTKVIASVFTMILTLAFSILPSMLMSDMSDEQMLLAIESLMSNVGKIYPPAVWLANGVSGVNYLNFILFILLSVAVAVIFTLVFAKVYMKVCTALASNASDNKKVQMDKLKQSSPLRALYKKEIKRLFSSTIYMTNTLIGNLMALIFSVILLFPSEADIVGGDVGIISIILPIVFGMVANLSPTTTSSVSLEGKNWGAIKALPVDKKTVFHSKILLNLTFALPTAIISAVMMMFSPMFNVTYFWFIVLMPITFAVLMTLVGLCMDIRAPSFNWTSEAQPVKQGKSVIFTMLIDFGVGLISIVLSVAFGVIGMILALALILGLSVLFYKIISSIDLRSIDG